RAAVPVRSAQAAAPEPLERVRYVISRPEPATPHAAPAKAKANRRAAPRIAPAVKKIPPLELTIPAVDLDTTVNVTDLDLTSKVTDSSDFKPTTLADAIGAALI